MNRVIVMKAKYLKKGYIIGAKLKLNA